MVINKTLVALLRFKEETDPHYARCGCTIIFLTPNCFHFESISLCEAFDVPPLLESVILAGKRKGITVLSYLYPRLYAVHIFLHDLTAYTVDL